jgi:hypothetical protein
MNDLGLVAEWLAASVDASALLLTCLIGTQHNAAEEQGTRNKNK